MQALQFRKRKVKHSVVEPTITDKNNLTAILKVHVESLLHEETQ